ncbi:MAG: lytic transglycosylase domain-containing protein [Proteobacteria bacterium]|nr:lytic transglycosylase domain-containing protein [Pseudomonadota bacterium]
MTRQRSQTTALLLLILFSLSLATKSYGSLQNSVIKYQNRGIVRQDIERLAQFDEYIRYFSGFSYFLPKHKVSADFVRALILAESGANPNAISAKNARGLGQILFSTGAQAGKELAKSLTFFRHVSKHTLNNLSEEDLFDPAINILITCYLIAKYNYRFNGRLDLVVSAWNAGENTESLSFHKHAPYRETEDLIGKINAYYIFLLKTRKLPK